MVSYKACTILQLVIYMRKLYIFTFHLFLFSFSIYGHSRLIDISEQFNLLFSEEDLLNGLKVAVSQYPSKGKCLFKFQAVLTEGITSHYLEQGDNVIKIARICPENKENFNNESWEKYKRRILKKYKRICPSVTIDYTKNRLISAIKDPQDQYCSIMFYMASFDENKAIPLSNEEKVQMINKLNAITQYNFVSLNVKVTDIGFWEQMNKGVLPITILKKGDGIFFDDLETDDPNIKIRYIKPEDVLEHMRIDFEFKELETSDNSENLTDFLCTRQKK